MGILLVAALATMALAGRASREPAPFVREVHLPARGTAFADSNPVIEVRVGDRVRLVVANRDPGVVHAISVPALDDRVIDIAHGEEAVLEISARAPGEYEYVCTRHYPLMKGRLLVH